MDVVCLTTQSAANANRLASARVLLEAGANVDAVSKDGETALMVAVKVLTFALNQPYPFLLQEINLPLVNLLLAKKPNLDLQNPDGNTGTYSLVSLLWIVAVQQPRSSFVACSAAAHFAGFSLSEEVFNKIVAAGASLSLKNAAGGVPELGTSRNILCVLSLTLL